MGHLQIMENKGSIYFFIVKLLCNLIILINFVALTELESLVGLIHYCKD